MRYLRTALVAAGVAALVLSAGFAFQMPWVTSLWPLPDRRLSFIFMSAILAGAAVPLIWIGLSGVLGALPGYGLGFGVMYAGMAAYALYLYMENANRALLIYGLVSAGLALLCLVLLLSSRRYPSTDPRPMPRLLRIAFLVEIGVLTSVGIALALQIPNILPWPLSPESSVMYGWVFLGIALYFIYALVHPQWYHARGPLLGFLAYDLVLIVPFLRHFATVRPEHLPGLIVATAIIIGSGALAVYYLFLNPATRTWTMPDSSEKLASTLGSKL